MSDKLTETLRSIRDLFEDDNEHFMASFVEAIQHDDVASALRIHELYVQFLDPQHENHQRLIDERESIRKRWLNRAQSAES